MVPEFIPNFLATLSHPPWAIDLRWGLHVTLHGEERVPFYSYVQHREPVAADMPRLVASFPQFGILPAELQLRILSFCPPKTLFQVMQVSSALRLEASKLFWAHSDAYVQVLASWLLAGAYPGSTFDDLSFLCHAQNVLVECDAATDDEIGPVYDSVRVIRQDRIATFWDSLTKRCPIAKRVIVNYCWRPFGPNKGTLPVPDVVHTLIQHAPLHVPTFAFIAEEVDKTTGIDLCHSLAPPEQWQRSLYQPLACGAWKRVENAASWKTILSPTKQFNGVVGQYMALEYKGNVVELQQNGLWPLMVEALDRHHFYSRVNDELFSCPSPDCSAYFERAGEWIVHAAKMHHSEWVAGDRFSILPFEVRRKFEQRETALQMQLDHIRQDVLQIQEDWNGDNGIRQKEIKRHWMTQLENDSVWDTGTTPSESRLWNNFLRHMMEAQAMQEREVPLGED